MSKPQDNEKQPDFNGFKSEGTQGGDVSLLRRGTSMTMGGPFAVAVTENNMNESGNPIVDFQAALLQRLTRKIYIENNRIVQVQGVPITIEGP